MSEYSYKYDHPVSGMQGIALAEPTRCVTELSITRVSTKACGPILNPLLIF